MFEKIFKSMSERAESYLSENNYISLIIIVAVVLLQMFNVSDEDIKKRMETKTGAKK